MGKITLWGHSSNAHLVVHMALGKRQTAMDRLLAFLKSLIAPFTKGEG